ncbi:PIN domain-containing protein [Leptolyngbya iicbica]|uniref:PIN domain-containing protein n=2 Tax=Cyanophyceae TaxID=3028117 RepID=A0A4Q7E137_9CYAN|nr:PIN domain-containing protein [Leptolyngbya sp. LK]RZM75225.1 PIN domain-containing protein [Leptolyngbya sp. LK]
MRRVLLDCDVILDVFLTRQPFVLNSAQVLDAAATAKVEGCLAGHAVTNIYYILRRQLGRDATHQALRKLLERLRVASITDEVVKAALQSPMSDFEDAVTVEAAKAAGIDSTVTRNLPDFAAASILVLPPEGLLEQLAE